MKRCKFQSSPDCYAGRNTLPIARSCQLTRFQSSPDCYAGRNTISATNLRYPTMVSILARLLRRAQQDEAEGHRRAGRCFNPRPTVTPGATAIARTLG